MGKECSPNKRGPSDYVHMILPGARGKAVDAAHENIFLPHPQK